MTSWKMAVGVAVLFALGGLGYLYSHRDGAISADTEVADAFEAANDEDPKLEFEKIEIERVKPNGSVEAPDGGVAVWFRNPAKEVIKSKQEMPGAPKRGGDSCRGYEIETYWGGTKAGGSRRDTAEWTHDNYCGAQLPKCKVTEIWKRAIEKGAPNPAMAKITAYVEDDGGIHWWLTIDDSKWDFDDNC